ncbi:MAG: hypothetical protein WBC51_15450 [Vicinamibacterales bacterium]
MRLGVAWSLVLAQMACSSASTAPSDPPCVTSWNIAGQQQLSPGERVLWQAPMTSTCLIGGGWTLPVRWRSSHPSVAEVAILDSTCRSDICQSVVVTGRSAGVATIFATNPSDNVEKSAQITVIDSPVLPPSQVTISLPIRAAPATQRFTIGATAQWSSGTVKDVTLLADWSSSDQNVATVSAGNVVAIRAGTTLLRVEYLGVSTEMPLQVLDASKDGLAVAALTESTALVAYVLTSTAQAELSVEVRDDRGAFFASRGQSVVRGVGIETLLMPNATPPPEVRTICLMFRMRPVGGQPISADGGCQPR